MTGFDNAGINVAKWFKSDHEFNQLYSLSLQKHDTKHWTSLKVARKAAEYLADGLPARVLDIGSGIGKFCLASAYFQPQAQFFGIEQREKLVEAAKKAKELLQLPNVNFEQGNFTSIDFNVYDHFYFFNSFFENLTGTEKIDNSVTHSSQLYDLYNRSLFTALATRPAGTKLVTFHSLEDEVPDNYHVVGVDMASKLKFWLKV